MATSIGHALAGLTVWLAARRVDGKPAAFPLLPWAPAFVLAANLPDLDFFAGWLFAGDFHAYHGGASHSLLASVLMAATMTLLLPRQGLSHVRIFFCLWLAVLSHLAIDMSLGAELGWHQALHGLPLLWPLSDTRFYAPVTLFYGVHHETVSHLLSWHNVRTIVCEIATFALPLLLLWRHARHARLTDAETGSPP